jgi:SsrA-binding protein
MSDKELATNRKAFHDFEILETYEAGIALQGTEVKSLRDGGGHIQDSYVRVLNGEAFLFGSTIMSYKFGNIHNHEEKRDRKLLLHKSEIILLKKATEEKGLTVVPLGMYLKKGKVKLKIGIARGKKLHDKRQALKEREDKRHMQREMKNR